MSADPEQWSHARERIEDLLLGGPRTMTRGEVRERTGLSAEHTFRLWGALGFAASPDDVRAFADADADALALARDLLDEETFDEDEEVAVARALGQSMARLAEWQANILRRNVMDAGDGQDPESVVAAIETLVPTFEKLQSYVWRRHLAATAGRLLDAMTRPADDRSPNRAVVGFADIVGFTMLSRKVSEDELRSLLERFETVCAAVIARHRGRVVKTLGDEVLFVCDEPGEAAAIARDLHAEVPDEAGHLALRIGMALGEVLPRYGDVYGPVVNIASRLTSEARPRTTLVDDELTAALRDSDADVDIRAVPQVSVRGYRHLRPHVIRPRD